MEQFTDWVSSNIAWTALTLIAKSAICSLIGYLFLHRAFKAFKQREQKIWYWITFPMIIVVSLLFFSSYSHPKPDIKLQLAGEYSLGSRIGSVATSGQQMAQQQVASPVISSTDESRILLIVTVSNAGYAQTSLSSWSLQVQVGDQKATARRLQLPNVLNILLPNQETVTFFQSDDLFEKSTQPVPPGGTITGLAAFSIPSMRASFLVGQKPRYTVSCVDVFGTTYTVDVDTAKLDLPPDSSTPESYSGLQMMISDPSK